MGLESIAIESAEGTRNLSRVYRVVNNASKPHGYEVNVTPGGGTQIGAKGLLQFKAEVRLFHGPATGQPQERLREIIRLFEALAGEIVYIDHRINPDPTLKWVVAEATPVDGGDSAETVTGRLTCTEVRESPTPNALPLGTIIIPLVASTVVEEAGTPGEGDQQSDSPAVSNDNCKRAPSKIQEWGKKGNPFSKTNLSIAKAWWGQVADSVSSATSDFAEATNLDDAIDAIADAAEFIGEGIGDAFTASTSIFRKGPCIEGEVT